MQCSSTMLLNRHNNNVYTASNALHHRRTHYHLSTKTPPTSQSRDTRSSVTQPHRRSEHQRPCSSSTRMRVNVLRADHLPFPSSKCTIGTMSSTSSATRLARKLSLLLFLRMYYTPMSLYDARQPSWSAEPAPSSSALTTFMAFFLRRSLGGISTLWRILWEDWTVDTSSPTFSRRNILRRV